MAGGQRYLGEEVCRQAMAHVFGGTFKSNTQRLKRLHGASMQLDGFEHFLETPNVIEGTSITEVAFEFQGHPSHYEDPVTVARDLLRAQYCRALGILLVVIDRPKDWSRLRDCEYMFEHVCASIRHAVHFPDDFCFESGFSIDLHNWTPDVFKHQELKDAAFENGFALLEEKWLGLNAKHRFVHMESGKSYQGLPKHLLSNSGFPKDLRSPSDKLQALSHMATEHGFELLETQWLGSKTKHRFEHLASGITYAWPAKQIMGRDGFPKSLRSAHNAMPQSQASLHLTESVAPSA